MGEPLANAERSDKCDRLIIVQQCACTVALFDSVCARNLRKTKIVRPRATRSQQADKVDLVLSCGYSPDSTSNSCFKYIYHNITSHSHHIITIALFQPVAVTKSWVVLW